MAFPRKYLSRVRIDIYMTVKGQGTFLSFVAEYIQPNFTLLRDELPINGDGKLLGLMKPFLNEENIADIKHCTGARQKKSKLLKIILKDGNLACLRLLGVIEEDLGRGDLKRQIYQRREHLQNRGRPILNVRLNGLNIERLLKHRQFLEEELEPMYISDLLFEEYALNILDHDRVEGKRRRRAQAQCLLEAVRRNENDCFHFFLYTLQKENNSRIIEELEKPEKDADRYEIKENLEWKITHRIIKVPDDVHSEGILLKLSVTNPDIKRVLYQLFHSHWNEILEEAISHGQMIIEVISFGSIILQLRPLTEQSVRTLLNAKNNRLLEMIFGMLRRINISKMMDDSNQLEIHVQISCIRSNKPMPDRTEATIDPHSKAEEIRKMITSNYKKNPGRNASNISKRSINLL